jgi:hypothetical protein
MPDDKVKLPRSSYDELCKIIKAYGRTAKPASLDQVNSLAGVGTTVISANNLFLSSIGVIEGGKAKAVTARGKELAAALEHNIPDETQKQWFRIVQENEFLNKMRTAVQIRRSMELSAFEAHIAYSAGEAKSSQVMTGARTVIDILRAAGAIVEKDGQLVPSEPLSEGTPTEPDKAALTEERRGSSTQMKTIPLVADAARSGVIVRIDLRIDAKPSELDGLGGKIRKLLDDIQIRSSSDTDHETPTA